MRGKYLTIALLMLLGIDNVYAQWEGGLKVDGGWNFKQSNTENLDFKLKYNGQKFYFGTNVYVGHGFPPSSQVTSILDAKKEESEYYSSDGGWGKERGR